MNCSVFPQCWLHTCGYLTLSQHSRSDAFLGGLWTPSVVLHMYTTHMSVHIGMSMCLLSYLWVLPGKSSHSHACLHMALVTASAPGSCSCVCSVWAAAISLPDQFQPLLTQLWVLLLVTRVPAHCHYQSSVAAFTACLWVTSLNPA